MVVPQQMVVVGISVGGMSNGTWRIKEIISAHSTASRHKYNNEGSGDSWATSSNHDASKPTEVLYSLISLKKARHPGYSKGVLGQNNGGLTPIKETDNDPALSLGIQMVIESQLENHVFVHRERRQ